MLGWSPSDRSWRSVRLDRVTLRTPNGPRFDERTVPGGDVGEYFVSLLDRGDSPDQWPCAGSATVEQPAAVVARYAPGGTRVESLGPTTSRVTLGAWSWNGIAALLGSLDAPVTDVEPEELRLACTELARRLD